MDDVRVFVKKWSTSECQPVVMFEQWVQCFQSMLMEEIQKCKKRYRRYLPRYTSVFDKKSVKKELSYFQDNFVICPVDKAANNFAVICKRYYIEVLLKECTSDPERFSVVSENNVSVISEQRKKLGSLCIQSEIDSLPYMYLLPKFHKAELSQRYVISYGNCTVKPLAKRITIVLKAVQYQIISYCRMMRVLTGINRDWVIHNNQPILNHIDKVNACSTARNITTYDFSTLYTNFSLDDIKTAMTSVINLAFKHSKKKYISVHKSSFNWCDSPRASTISFSEESLVDSIVWLLDNSFFTIGDQLFKQLVGVPIGVDCGPFVANLTLFYFENKWLETTYKTDYASARKLNGTFRLIDDITSLNSDGKFEEVYSQIYPQNLTLKKENSGNQSANVLDLNISITDNMFDVQVYDKRDDFNFHVSNFPFMDSNISKKCCLGVFKSQVIRYLRIASRIDTFIDRCRMLCNTLISKGYEPSSLVKIFTSLTNSGEFQSKFDFKNLAVSSILL